MSDVTRILSQIDAGDPSAAEQLLPLVYDELRKLAAAKLAHEKPGQTLQATALVHEAYLRLVGGGQERSEVRGQRSEEDQQMLDLRDQRSASVPATSDLRPPISDLRLPTPVSCPLSPASFHSRGHFFAAAAEAMRRILVESARAKQRLKRGGDLERVPLEEFAVAAPESDDRLLALDEALAKLEQKDPRKAELVKLRYFAGLTIEQAAQALEIGTSTADRDWSYARAWLFREMTKK